MGKKNKRRTLVISDIHGCYNEFVSLLEQAQYNGKNDKLVLLGDYVDRGADSFKVIKKIQKLQRKFGKENVIALRGNHEDMLIDYLIATETNRNAYLDFYYNGGDTTVKSFTRHNAKLADELKWLQSLPYYHEDMYFYYVHAGLKPNTPMKKQKVRDILWIREEFYNAKNPKFDKMVIFGHTPTINWSTNEPIHFGHAIGIDTGCVFEGRLTCLAISGNEITHVFQVDKEKVYTETIETIYFPKDDYANLAWDLDNLETFAEPVESYYPDKDSEKWYSDIVWEVIHGKEEKDKIKTGS